MSTFNPREAHRSARMWALGVWRDQPDAIISVLDIAGYLRRPAHHNPIPWSDVPSYTKRADGLYDRGELPQIETVRPWLVLWIAEGFAAVPEGFPEDPPDVVEAGPNAKEAILAGRVVAEGLARRIPGDW